MKKHLPLIIGISLPFIMIVVVILVVSVPKTFMNPKFSFIYTVSSYNPCVLKTDPQATDTNGCDAITYVVENEKLVKKVVASNNGYVQKLYLYDMDRDSSKEILVDEGLGYVLRNESRSPDGYEVEYQYGNSGIFEIFGGGYGNNARWVIKKGIATKPLSVTNSQDRYYYGGGQIGFLGWIIK